MAKTIIICDKTGLIIPSKSRRKLKDRKFFGFRYGSGSERNAIKGVDFMNSGYPLELRRKSVIKQKIQDDITKEELNNIS